jgi:carbonic anhydrase
MIRHFHHGGCGCLPSSSPAAASSLSRRGILGLGFAGAVVASFPALAASGSYEAMLVNCIDPRVTTFSFTYMAGRGDKDLYSQFTIAGGPIGVVAPAFADWQKTFWENLAISVQLHNIKRVVGLTHRDCGAAAVAYGDRIKTDWAFETAKHTEALNAFRAAVGQHHPKLAVDTGIMALDGTVEVVT